MLFEVPSLTNTPAQKQNLVLVDGTQVVVSMRYVSLQVGWYLQTISYAGTLFELHGVRIVNSPNFLHQYRNKIPFGLACDSPSGREPTLIDDFASGASVLYILDTEDVANFTRLLSG